MRKWAGVVLAAAVGSVLGTACGGSTPPAAVVEGRRIERASFRRELVALRSSPDIAAQTPVMAPGTLPTEIGAGWLSALIYQEVLRAEFVRRGLDLTPGSVESAEEALTGQLGPSAELLPAWFRRRVAERNAISTALREAFVGPTDEAALNAYYEANRAVLAPACVAHILVPTKEEADALAAAVRSGGDFAALARSRSVDQGSAESGGVLGCVAPGSFVEPFAEAVRNAPLGELQGPLETRFGWHLLVVSERRDANPADIRAELELARGEAGERAIREFLLERFRKASVRVDPRYGRFTQLSGEPLPRVVPPDIPDPPDARRDSTPVEEGDVPVVEPSG
ncbi:MAG: peptidylprolyl isomerase [Acidimicrobiia bacterium]